MHIKMIQREKAAYVYLRKNHKYSIDVLAKAFGRSKSLVWKVLDFNMKIGAIPPLDNRTFHPRIRRLSLVRQWNTMTRYLKLWEAFILGALEKPP
jgi:hypothetical protein